MLLKQIVLVAVTDPRGQRLVGAAVQVYLPGGPLLFEAQTRAGEDVVFVREYESTDATLAQTPQAHVTAQGRRQARAQTQKFTVIANQVEAAHAALILYPAPYTLA